MEGFLSLTVRSLAGKPVQEGHQMNASTRMLMSTCGGLQEKMVNDDMFHRGRRLVACVF